MNSNHDHSSVANGGGLSVNAFDDGINASSSTFLRGDGTWANSAGVTETISGAASNQDLTLANWTTALSPNTVICAQVLSSSGFTWLQGELAIAAN